MVTTDRADPSEPTDWSAHRAALHPEDALWTVLDDTADPDPDFHARQYFYADRRPWWRDCLDPLLRAVADGTLCGPFVTDEGAAARWRCPFPFQLPVSPAISGPAGQG